MDNAIVPFETLAREHPQLTEKALVDFINGLEVIDDHIRVRETVNSKFIARTWSRWNGESDRRQQTIDQHTTESLKTVSIWLQCLQQQQIQSDLAITDIANKLLETRKGLMILLNKHQALNHQVQEILTRIDDLENEQKLLSNRLDQVDSGRLASQQIEAVFDKWKAGRLGHFPILVRLFLVFDELYWGDFGNYCRKCSLEHREIQRLIQQVKDKSLVQLTDDWQKNNLPPAAYVWQTDLTLGLQNLAPDYCELIAFLTDEATSNTMPMLWSLNQLAKNLGQQNTLQHKNLPIVLSPQNAINRFSADFDNRYANDNL